MNLSYAKQQEAIDSAIGNLRNVLNSSNGEAMKADLQSVLTSLERMSDAEWDSRPEHGGLYRNHPHAQR